MASNSLPLAGLARRCRVCLSDLQVVHFIRHGEGFHNIGYESNLDPHLTEFGWQQAAALKQHLKTLEQPLNVQVRPWLTMQHFPVCMVDSAD